MSILSNLELMRVEPRLFTDAADSGLTLVVASDAVVSDTDLTSASSDFLATGVTTGDVVVVAGEAIEITSVDTATQLSTSRRRLSDASPVLKPSPGTGLSMSIISFQPLIDRVQGQLLAAAGIDPLHPTHPLSLSDVTNPDDLKPLLATRVAATALARASAVAPTDDSLAALAAFYRPLADEAARFATIMVDLDGDGQADEARRLSAMLLMRA